MEQKLFNKTPDKKENLVSLYDTKQAAKYLNIKPQTLNRWRHEGYGPPFIKLGSLVRYRYQDLTTWIDKCKRKNTIQINE